MNHCAHNLRLFSFCYYLIHLLSLCSFTWCFLNKGPAGEAGWGPQSDKIEAGNLNILKGQRLKKQKLRYEACVVCLP